MKVAILQLAPKLGEVQANIDHANELLAEAQAAGRLDDVQLLISPEMAFTGYNHTAASIAPLLEPTAGGPSAHWALAWARRLSALVAIGYPERSASPAAVVPEHVSPASRDVSPDRAWFSPRSDRTAAPRAFNALLTVAPDGRVVAHARKTHLYFTDAPWARASPTGFAAADLPLHLPEASRGTPAPAPADQPSGAEEALPPDAPDADADASVSPVRTAFGICMDLNPRAFRAPPAAHELAAHVLAERARLLLVSAAWMEADPPPDLTAAPNAADNADAADAAGAEADDAAPQARRATEEPERATVEYWIGRLAPLIARRERTAVVVANRAGREPGEVRTCDLDVSAGAGDDDDENKAAVDGLAAGRPWPAAGALVAREARYAGSSCVLLLGAGRAVCCGAMGRAAEGVGVVDVGAWLAGEGAVSDESVAGNGRARDGLGDGRMHMQGLAWTLGDGG